MKTGMRGRSVDWTGHVFGELTVVKRLSWTDAYGKGAGSGAHLGFRTTTTLRRLLQAGELSAYVRSGPDLRATYLDVAPKGRPTLRQHVQAHTSCRGNSPLWGADYESWPKGSRNWTEVANGYLDLPQWGPPPWTELQWATLRNVIELAQEP